MCWVVVIGSPLVEMVRDIIASSVGGGVFEINDNVAVMRRLVAGWIIQFEEIAVLRVVVWNVSPVMWSASRKTHERRPRRLLLR
jgi:hypothetical protein